MAKFFMISKITLLKRQIKNLNLSIFDELVHIQADFAEIWRKQQKRYSS